MALLLAAPLPAMAQTAPAQQAPAQTAPAPIASATPAAAPLTTADFARLPFVEQARLSPNGEVIAGLFGSGGLRKLCLFDLFEKGNKVHCTGIPDGMDINGFDWVNDDFVLLHLQQLVTVEGSRIYMTRLAAVNRLTQKITYPLQDLNGQNASDVLWQASNGAPEILVAGRDSVYMGNDFWPTVYRVNLATQSKRVAQLGLENVNEWAADATGRVRMGVSYNDAARIFTLLYRGETNGTLHVIDKANTRKREALDTPILFVPGTDHALVEHTDGKDRDSIYEFDLPSQKDVRLVYQPPEGERIGDVILARDGGTLLGVVWSGAKGHVEWLDPQLAEIQANFDKAVGDRTAHIISFSANRKRMLVRLDRPDAPGGLYFFDIDDGRLQRLSYFNETMGGRRLAPVSLFHYTARDGLPIEGILTLPEQRAAHNLPVIVMPHGGPWGHNELGYDYWAQFLAHLGYAVLQPNFRGSTGYGQEFERRGEGQMGLAMQDDINDALAWAVKEGIADPKRACIMGASYGGYATLWGLARDPQLWRCGISISGVASVRREVDGFDDYVMGGKFRDDWKRMTPDFAAVSPLNFVDKITAPLLLVHGKKDVTVDYNQSSSMYSKMQGAGKKVQLVSLPQADHYFTREADRLVLLQSIQAFLAANNPADPPAQP